MPTQKAKLLKKPNLQHEPEARRGGMRAFGRLRALVMMQLKDKIDFSFLKNKKQTLFKIVWTVLGFAAAVAAIYLVFALVVKFGLFSFLQTFNFRAFLVIMTVVIILSMLSCLVNVTTSLYFARDNQILLTQPVKSSTIFTSKIIVCYIYELLKNFAFVWPFLLAYGLTMALPVTYFLWSVVAVIILTTLVVVLCGLLSIPAMGVVILSKRYRALQIGVVVVLLAGLIIGVVAAINAIPADIDLVRDWGKIFWGMQDFLTSFASNFVIFDYLLQFLTGMQYNSFVFDLGTTANLITFGVIVGVILLSAGLIYVLSKPLFLKMASDPVEYRKRTRIARTRSHRRPPFVAAVAQDTLRTVRTPSVLYGILAAAIIAPIAILLQNRIFAAMDTQLSGQYMVLAFNVLIVLLILLSTNNSLASAYSREGAAAYQNKIYPVPYRIPLSGKLILNMLLCLVSIVVSVVVMNIFLPMGLGNAIMLALGMSAVYLAHLLWSAELDIMHPQYRQYQTTGKSHRNPNEIKSTVWCFALSGLFALILYLLICENFALVFPKILCLGIALLGLRLYLYLTRIKLYYKEK